MSQRFGKVVSIGSGAEAILMQVQELDDKYQYGMTQPTDGDAQFPEFGTVSQNLYLLAQLYWREFVAPWRVYSGWGGAYDLIFQNESRVFQHLTDYTLILRVFDVDRVNDGVRPVNILKYERRPEISVVWTLSGDHLDGFGAKDMTAGDDVVEVNVEKETFTMNSKFHVSIIAVGKANRFLLAPMIQIDGNHESSERKPTVFSWFDSDGRLSIAVDVEHDRWLTEQAMAYYKMAKVQQ